MSFKKEGGIKGLIVFRVAFSAVFLCSSKLILDFGKVKSY
jgi:hypothetical protein